MTEQGTILQKNHIQYSDVMTKAQIGELYTRVFHGMTNEVKNAFIKNFCLIEDTIIVRAINSRLNIRIRLFAPGKYQIVWNGTILTQ